MCYFDLTSLYRRAEILEKNSWTFFGDLKTPKGHFEINWTLDTYSFWPRVFEILALGLVPREQFDDIRSFPISFSHWSQAWLPQLLRIFFQCKPVFIYKRKSGKFSKTKFNLISTIYRFARGPLWVHPAASHRQWAGKTSLWRLRLKRKRLLKEVNRF